MLLFSKFPLMQTSLPSKDAGFDVSSEGVISLYGDELMHPRTAKNKKIKIRGIYFMIVSFLCAVLFFEKSPEKSSELFIFDI